MLVNAWHRLLSRLKRKNHSHAPRVSRLRPRSLFLERLEDRLTPTTVSWTNPQGGSWNDPSNWSTAALPTASDDVAVNLPAGVTVQLSNGSISVNSLQLSDTLVLDGGSLTVADDLFNAGAIHLASGGGAALVVNGTLTNDPGAVLSADQGAASVQQIAANINNHGTVNVDPGVGLVILGSTSSGPHLTQAGGTLTVPGGGWVVQVGGVLHYTGGALPAEFVAFNSELDIADTVTANAVIEIRGTQNTLDRNLAPGVTLWVQGWNGNGDARLTAVDGAVNDGTIRLESGGSAYNSDLAVVGGGTFTNAAGGVIDVQAGTGGGRDVYGNWVNDGTVDVEPGTGLVLQGVGSQAPVFTQAAGSLTVPGGSWVVQVGGVFHYTGGLLPGEFVAFNSDLDIADTVTATAVIEIRGVQNTLDRNLAPGVTLWVQGWNGNGDARLTTVDGAVNDGTIRLESGGSAYNSDLAVAGGGTFTNAAEGVIDVRPGSGGGRDVYGDWTNDGTVDVEAGTGLVVQGAGSSGPHFTQAGGSLTVPGGSWVVQVGGVFHFTGGALPGEFVAFNSELDIAAAVTATALIEVRGQSNLLDENRAPGVTLWVQGCDWNGNAALTTVAGAVNAGTILLESLHHDFWSSNLVVSGGGTLTNTATGVITAQPGAGGGRGINGNLVNQGTVTAAAPMQWSGSVTNAGTIDIAAGVTVNLAGLNGGAPTLSQTAGALIVNGSLILPGGTLDVVGGALNGGGVFQVQNAQLSFGPTATGSLPVQVVGQGDVLLTNQGGVTLWVRGDDLFNQGVLTVAPGAVNAGTILLQSASTYWGSFLFIQDGLDNTSTGVIHVTHGAGGGRSITGDLTNEGTLVVDAGAALAIDGATDAGPTLTQDGGVIQADGRVLLNGGFLDFEGGAITGAFTVDGSQIYVDPGVTDPSLIRVVGGGNLLLDNGSAATTLLVQGDDGFNGGVLNVAPDATNAGTIQLDSASGYWGSSLVMQDMLDNLPGGSILVTQGAGGGRSIVGDIDNEGLLSVAASEQIQITGATDAGPTFIQDGGLIQADGRLVFNGGLFDFESGDISGSFLVNNSQIYVGPDATDPATVYVVGSGNTLLGNEGPSVTLQVQGDDGFGQGVLTAAAGAVNAGSIVLDSTSSYFGSALAAPQTMLNASGGLIAVADDGGGGSRSLVGDFINAGAVFVPAGRQLSLDGATGAGPMLIQTGGVIAAAGPFVQHGGLFDFESGAVFGSFLVNGARIFVGPGVVTPNTVEVVGPGNVLLGNDSSVTSLWVRGDDAYDAGVLTAAPEAFNAGTIVLASNSDYWGETLAAPNGLVNRASGHIAVYGGGGPAALTGTLTNDAYLSLSGVGAMSIDTLINHGVVGVDASGLSVAPGVTAVMDTAGAFQAGGGDAAVQRLAGDGSTGGTTDASDAAAGASALRQLVVQQQSDGSAAASGDAAQWFLTRLTVGAWTNDGTVAVDPDTQLQIATDGSGRDTFTQAGGLVAAAGSVIVDGGLFHFTGGGLVGEFTVRDGGIRVDDSVTQPSTINVVGHGNVLLDNAGAATLRVQGGSPLGDGDAVLTAADASTNRGTIILESLDGTYRGYFRVPQGRFTNGQGGVIQVHLPPGDSGQGSITAGALEGDGGGVTDATGLPVLEGLQAAWDAVQAAEASGDDSSIDAGTVMDALMSQTPGVSDGVISVLALGGDYLAGGGTAELDSVFANFGAVSLARGTNADLAAGASPAEAAAAAPVGLSATGPSALSSSAVGAEAWLGWAAAPAAAVGGSSGGSSSGGDQSAVDVAQGMAGAVQQATAAYIGDMLAPVVLGQGITGVVGEGIAMLFDAGQGAMAVGSMALSELAGTEPFNPTPVSSLMKGLESAGAQGQLGAYLGNAAFQMMTLGVTQSAASFGPVFQHFKDTGDVLPLAHWAGTAGANVYFGAEVLTGALGVGASLAGEGDAALLAAEGGGPEVPGMGTAGALLNFFADESGHVDISPGDGSQPGESAAPSDPGADLSEAQKQLGEVDETAAQTAAAAAKVGDAADAAGLVEAMEETAVERAAAAAQSAATVPDTTAAAALEQQTAEAQSTDTTPATVKALVDPRKFTDYIFKEGDPTGKGAAFRQLGYDKANAAELVNMWETEAAEKYASGEYSLGRKDQYGQRIDIEIEVPGIGDAAGQTSYMKSGWMIQADGSIKLNTPFSGYTR